MKIPFNDLKRLHKPVEKKLQEALQRTLDRSWYIKGAEVDAFEKAFAAYTGVDFCIGCGNGTDALEIALAALGISSGDEVIVPANTYIATAEAVLNRGATPVFADVDPRFYTIDPEGINSLVNTKTKAIIPVHLYGCPAEMDAVMRIAENNGLFVVEDCAQAHGAVYRGRRVGSIGHAGAFSFYPTKNLGALGDGGAITTNDETLAAKCRMIADHGRDSSNEHRLCGRNSRLDELQAAFLNVKLPFLERWNAERNAVAEHYSQALRSVAAQTPACPEGSRHVFHLFGIQSDARDELSAFLKKKGVETLIHYNAILPEMPFLRAFAGQRKFLAEGISKRILSLPLFPGMTKEEVDYVCDAVSKAAADL